MYMYDDMPHMALGNPDWKQQAFVYQKPWKYIIYDIY